MTKELEELLNAVNFNFPLIHHSSTESPSDKTVKSTPTKNATTTARSSTWKENTKVTTMTTEIVNYSNYDKDYWVEQHNSYQ
jgi:hypothetical protein